MSKMSVRIESITIALICAVLVGAVPFVAQTPASRSDSAAFLSRVAGVYKAQFQNGNIDGDKYQSEDILEVVPIDDHAAYVRMMLEFFNGHSGGIYGIAIYRKDSLMYDNGKDGDQRCIIEYICLPKRL